MTRRPAPKLHVYILGASTYVRRCDVDVLYVGGSRRFGHHAGGGAAAPATWMRDRSIRKVGRGRYRYIAKLSASAKRRRLPIMGIRSPASWGVAASRYGSPALRDAQKHSRPEMAADEGGRGGGGRQGIRPHLQSVPLPCWPPTGKSSTQIIRPLGHRRVASSHGFLENSNISKQFILTRPNFLTGRDARFVDGAAARLAETSRPYRLSGDAPRNTFCVEKIKRVVTRYTLGYCLTEPALLPRRAGNARPTPPPRVFAP